MAVKVKDLLTLKIFNDARIATGAKGLDNEVRRISFTDSPIKEEVLNYSDIILEGDMYIHGLYSFIDKPRELLNLVRILVRSKTSGMFVVDEFFKELPREVIEYAESKNFPIIFIDRNIPYGKVIEITMEMILMNKSQTIAEMNIDNLLNHKNSAEDIIYYAKRIHGSFGRFYASLNFSIKTNSPLKEINMIQQLQNSIDGEIMRYKDDFIIVINLGDPRDLAKHIEYFKSLISKINPDYNIGISNVFSHITEFHKCIRQAISSKEMSYILGVNSISYKELNIYKILYASKDSSQIEEFYNDIFMPVYSFDQGHSSDLIETVQCFIKNNGDYKKTAEDMHQHHNTIRYRINKAKSLLNMEENLFEFVELFSVALKINKMKENKE